FLGGYSLDFIDRDPLQIGNVALADPLVGFDTAVLVGICDIGSSSFLGNPTFRDRLQAFLPRGGKLIIWDSECRETDYSKCVVPFTTTNPGAGGQISDLLQDVEENTLSSTDSTSPY